MQFEASETRRALLDLTPSNSRQSASKQPDARCGALAETVPNAIQNSLFLRDKMARIRNSEAYMTEQIKVEDIPRFFDSQVSSWSIFRVLIQSQFHDYVLGNNGSSSTRISSALKVRWMDPPGLYPGDIRSRHMLVEVQERESIPVSQYHKLVWRSIFRCNGSCQREIRPKQVKSLRTPTEEMVACAQRFREGIESDKVEAEARDSYHHSCDAILLVSQKAIYLLTI